MAYMDLSLADRADAGIAGAFARWTPARFSALEWSVVALARHDSIAGLKRTSVIGRALGSLFGLGRESRLADGRLEALRRVAVHAWHDARGVPGEERAAFHAAGFTDAQLSTLLESVATVAGGHRRSATA